MTIDEALEKLREFGTPEEIALYLKSMGFKGDIPSITEDGCITLCPLEVFFLEQTGIRIGVYGDFIMGENIYIDEMTEQFQDFVTMFDDREFPELIREDR